MTPAPAALGATGQEGEPSPAARPEETLDFGPEPADSTYHDDLARAEALERAERARGAEIAALRHGIAEVETRHDRLLRSTSWKLGARLAGLLPGAAGAEAFRPRFQGGAAPEAEAGADRSADQVARLLDAARAGEAEAALAGLGRLRDDWRASRAVRALCERAMVLIDAEAPDPRIRARALARLDALRYWGAGGSDGARIAFLARAIAETLPGAAKGGADRFAVNGWLVPDLMLLGQPGLADPARRVAEISAALRALAEVEVRLADPAGPARIDNLAAPMPAGVAGGTLVSVILVAEPGGASGAMLATALASLRAQSWRDLEILAVDDGAGDAAAAAIAKAAAEDPRVTPLRPDAPLGLHAARALALGHARGELIAWLDAAAWAHPARIERQARALLDARKAVGLETTRLRASETLRFERPPFASTLAERDPAGLIFRREAVTGQADAPAPGGVVESAAGLREMLGAEAVAMHRAPLTLTRVAPERAPASGGRGY